MTGKRTDVYELFTDGACLGNPGPGGWAFILKNTVTGQIIEGSGGERKTTNNRMEMMAVIKGLEQLEPPQAVQLWADSKYVVQGLSEWLEGWKRRGWRKADKKPVLNVDLWQQLDELNQQYQVSVNWVRGHTGHRENERCDQLATIEAEAQKKAERLS